MTPTSEYMELVRAELNSIVGPQRQFALQWLARYDRESPTQQYAQACKKRALELREGIACDAQRRATRRLRRERIIAAWLWGWTLAAWLWRLL